jgi:ABC-type sugar transport system ATPase subunit
MNFLEVDADGERARVDALEVPCAHRGPVTLGVRPHDVAVGAAAAGGVEATVDVVERLGWELHLHLRLGDSPLTVQVEAREVGEVAPGDRLPVRFSRYHLFDQRSGEVIR